MYVAVAADKELPKAEQRLVEVRMPLTHRVMTDIMRTMAMLQESESLETQVASMDAMTELLPRVFVSDTLADQFTTFELDELLGAAMRAATLSDTERGNSESPRTSKKDESVNGARRQGDALTSQAQLSLSSSSAPVRGTNNAMPAEVPVT